MRTPRLALGRASVRELAPLAAQYWIAILVMGFSVTVLSIVYASGTQYWANYPIVLTAQTLSVLTAVGTGVLLQLREVRVPGRWIVASGYALAAYTAMQAISCVLVLWLRVDNLAVSIVVGVGMGWWVVVLTVAQLTALAGGHHIRGIVRHRYSRFLIVYVVIVFVLFIPFGDNGYPFEHVPAPFGDTIGASPIVVALAPVFSYTWMAMLPIVPILLFWGARRSPAAIRRPMVVAAVASIMPTTIVLICEILWLAFMPAGMSQAVGEILLISSHGLGSGLEAIVLGVALRYAHRITPISDRAVSFFLSSGASILLLITAVSTSLIVSNVIGSGAVFVVAVIAVAFAVAAMAVRKRAVEWALRHIDPYRARARELLSREDPQARLHPARAAEGVFRAALRDPQLVLIVRLERGGWVDADGARADPEGSVPVLMAEEPVAAVRSGADPEAVHAVAAVLAEPLDRAVLDAELRDRAARLEEEQRRSETAAVDERQRLERNLHDGVQGRLLALALQLRQAESEDPHARLVFDEAVDSLRSAIDELRVLAAGSMPLQLTRDGLDGALDEFCRTMPLPVRLEVTDARFDPRVEAVAYFVVSEALTNAVKHGQATEIAVEVLERDGVLGIHVVDDGVGGADPRAGSGLRGLRERVRAVGGQLLVSEYAPHGTRVEASIPCGR